MPTIKALDKNGDGQMDGKELVKFLTEHRLLDIKVSVSPRYICFSRSMQFLT